MTEIKNAYIRHADIFIESHGILTLCLDLDYGGSRQSFGLHDTRENLTWWVQRIFEVTGKKSWKDLRGTAIRVKASHSSCEAIGNILEDKWLNPREDLQNV